MKEPLWRPSEARVKAANITAYRQRVSAALGQDLETYDALHEWSVSDTAAFWRSIWDMTDVETTTPPGAAFEPGDNMRASTWFEGATFNFAEHLLRGDDSAQAIVFNNERGDRKVLTYADLRKQVALLARALRALNVKAGDRVAGFLPNIPEAVVAMLATVSIGAVWTSTSPDFGERGVLDRFGQVEPVVLFAADGYSYKGKDISSIARLPGLVSQLPSIRKVIIVPYLSAKPNLDTLPRADLFTDVVNGEPPALTFSAQPFNHPLYILYSSGTTGVPKCIVHGAGGTLLQHVKEHRLHGDIKPGDRVFYFTTCGWMMWNWLVSALASKATIMLYDGSPFHPDPGILWRIAAREHFKIFGTSAKYLAALEKAGYKPREAVDLSALEAVFSTGSPLSDASFRYVYRDIKADLHLASITGGTDIVSCFMLGNPTLPVYAEEIQCRGLGMKVEIFNTEGQPVVGEQGELVCTQSFPSQPIYFWNDPDDVRYRSAYFETYPGVWRHGDWVEETRRGGFIMYGRSDATLNPGGVRIGTSEIYRAIEPMDALLDSLVVGRDIPGNDVEVVLFVKLAEGAAFDDELVATIKATIRREATPRHVPAKIYAVPDIPYTLSGKKVELAVRRILHGLPVPNRDALANPEALEHFVAMQSQGA